jgi:hypothetical protein
VSILRAANRVAYAVVKTDCARNWTKATANTAAKIRAGDFAGLRFDQGTL